MSREIVVFDRQGLAISDVSVSTPGGALPLRRVRKAWVEAQRPGFASGALLSALGLALLLRGAGLMRLVGAGVLAAGVLRARETRHVLKLALDDARTVAALSTHDEALAREALAALERARSLADR